MRQAWWLAAILVSLTSQAAADDAVLERKLEELQRQNEALRQQSEALQQQIDAIRAELHGVEGREAASETTVAPTRLELDATGPKVILGGQYRINSYVVDEDVDDESRTASRVRARQNVDIYFDEAFKTHLQFELSHTTDNVTTTSESSRGTNIDVRHAVLDYTFHDGTNAQAGIVPLSDEFGDTQFSSDWDYNPLAVAGHVPLAGGTLRAFAGNLAEGDETVAEDDFVHYQMDYVLPLRPNGHVNVGAGIVNLPDPTEKDRFYGSLGVGAGYPVTAGVFVQGFVIGSFAEKQLLGTREHASGVAAKLEVTDESGFGILATYASGDSDGSGFLAPMALARTNGYWGYTGLLTVQGPTDTGFDADSVNVSNNGLGLTTVQVKYVRPLMTDLDLYLAAGWFGNTEAPDGRDSLVGFDFIAMGTYHFTDILALDFGAAYALLQDSVSGYSNGVVGGVTFNQGAGEKRDKTALFTRLQAEF